MFTKHFWQSAVERAVKTAAQFGIAAVGATLTNLFELNVYGLFGAMGAGFVLSLLTSVASTRVGDPEDPSAID